MQNGVLPRHRHVRIGFDRDGLPAAELPVGSDQQLRAGVLHPELQRLGRETAKDQGMNGAKARHGQGDDNGFNQDRQVDDNPVPLDDAQRREGVRGPAHLILEFLIGDLAAIPGFALKKQCHLLALASGHMAVHAVDGCVELATSEPLDARDAQGGIRRIRRIRSGLDVRRGLRVRCLEIKCLRVKCGGEGVGGMPRLGPVKPACLLIPKLEPLLFS